MSLLQELNVYDQSSKALDRTNWKFHASRTAAGSDPKNVADGSATTLWSIGESQRNGNVALYFTFSSSVPGEGGLFNINYFKFNGVGAQG